MLRFPTLGHRLATCGAGVALVAVLLPVTLPAQGVRGFYQHPALHGNTIVFEAEGDLWTVPVTGGLARRLTTHAGRETSPVISPDGATVAFSASYEGPTEVYTMPLAGGAPVRRTWEGEASTAAAFTPDGDLVYQTTHYAGLPKPELVRVRLTDHQRTRVPLAGATSPAFDATGRTLWFVRPAYHNNVTKRYTGGTARDVWMFRDGAAEAVELTGDWRGESHSPMWWNGRVYFVTDRDGTMNLWSMREAGGDLRQHTKHAGWDVVGPSLHEGRIAYQLGADLHVYDIAAERDDTLAITLASDLDQLRQRWVNTPMEYLESVHLSPTGDRVVLTARGRVFVAPAKSGRLVRASVKDSVRYRDVVFTPDGRGLLGLSDESGELEFVRLPANGVGADSQLTRGGRILRFTPIPSPDGRRLAWTDNDGHLWLRDQRTGDVQRISRNTEGTGDHAWSPDSRWLAYAEQAPNSFRRLVLYDTETGTTTEVTSDRTNSFAPAWSPKGDFLYFLSDRNLRTSVGSPWGTRQPEPYFDRTIELYHVALRPGLRSPFRPDDELAPVDSAPARRNGGNSGNGSNGTPSPARPARVEITLDGLMARVDRVPVPAGNYAALAMNGDALFWLARGQGDEGNRTDVHALRIGNDDPKPVPIVDGVRSLELSANGQKLLVRRGDALHVIDAKPAKPGNLAESRVDLSGWRFPIDVRQDWRQLFVDAWRLERDWFYDPNFHGVDWQAVLDRHRPLVERVTTREELSVVIGWMVGELSALHTSVRGGDVRRGDDQVTVASLGARLMRDAAAGGYRIEHVYRHDPDYPDERAPLADPYLDVRAGDVITAVNGAATLAAPDIGELLRGQAGRQVLLTVARDGAARDVIVVPAGNESNLRYTDWELSRRLAVDSASDRTMGYVHLRAMGANDVNQWYREYYPQFDRQGLIIDVRHNRGGNIDAFILEKLLRKAWMYWQGRSGEPTWNMHYAFRGHLVVLVDQETASDGEAFADGFRRLGLGPVIGMRTWGGEIWLSSNNTLTDGGLARAPMTGVYGPEGEWLIEQIGVIPDIEVDNLPHATFNGRDAQLEAAIEYLRKKIAEDPRPVPKPPAHPNRAFTYPVP